jgi:hypothetical protein
MSAFARRAVLGLLLITVMAADGQGRDEPLRGACYCRMAEALSCTADLTEPECRRRCDEALCDDWFWKERLPCWNWGYGG